MTQTVVQVLGIWGYFGVFMLIAVENIFPPIPSEVILTFAGFLTTTTKLTYGGVVVAATLGSVAGALVLYGVGRTLSPERLDNLLKSKLAQRLRFCKEDYQNACDKFAKKGIYSVLFLRMVPILRSVISVPAGVAKMPMGIFLTFTTIGSAVWNILLIGLGKTAGAYWATVSSFFAGLTKYTRASLWAAILVICIVLYVRRHIAKTKQEKQIQKEIQ